MIAVEVLERGQSMLIFQTDAVPRIGEVVTDFTSAGMGRRWRVLGVNYQIGERSLMRGVLLDVESIKEIR